MATTHSSTSTRAVLAVALAGSALVLAACGSSGSSESGSASASPSAAASSSTRAGTPATPLAADSLPPLPTPPPAEPDAAAITAAMVGLTEETAVAKAEDAGYTTRVTSRDGSNFPMTMDYRTNRINLEVNNGVVTRAFPG